LFRGLSSLITSLRNYIWSEKASDINDFVRRVATAGNDCSIIIEVRKDKFSDTINSFGTNISLGLGCCASNQWPTQETYRFYFFARATFNHSRKDITLEYWLDDKRSTCDYGNIESIFLLKDNKENAFEKASVIADQMRPMLPGIAIEVEYYQALLDTEENKNSNPQ